VIGRKGKRRTDHPDVCDNNSMGLREDSSFPGFEHLTGCKISCADLQSTHCLPWIHISVEGQEERETYFFGSRYRSIYVFQAGKNGGGKASSLCPSCLGF